MPGLREALEERFDELDAGMDSADSSTGEIDAGAVAENADGDVDGLAGDPGGPSSAEGDRPRDEAGKFVAKPAAQDAPASSPAGPVAPGQGVAAAVQPAAPPAFKVPQSWKASVRELAAKLPPEFRPILEESARRDREATIALQAKAEAEKGASGWGEVVRPYEAQIRAAGAKPEQYVGNLLQTAHALFYGPGHMKPGVLANIIMQSGVPPQELDAALVAAMQGQGQRPQQAQPQEFRDPRLDQFFQAQQAQQAAEATEGATSFADSHEFFGDVAEDIAHQLDLAAAKGQKTVSEADMERFYRIACNLNDDVRTTMEQRKAASAVATAQAATQRSRNAASSVRSQPTAGVSAQPTGRRAAIESKYDELDDQ